MIRLLGDLAPLLRRLDDESVRRDLNDFFGPQADAYLRSCTRLAGQSRLPVLFWSWPVFWAWYLWFLWRKLWAEAALAIAIPCFVSVALGDWGWIAAYVLVCLLAKPAYLHAAARAIARADAMGLTDEARRAALRRAGGTSKMGAAAGFGVLVAACIAWTIWWLPTLLAQIDAWGLLPPE